MTDDETGVTVRDEQGNTRWIKAYSPGHLPEPGDVVWSYELSPGTQIIGQQIVPRDGDEGTVIV